jgi:hypothetical protein
MTQSTKYFISQFELDEQNLAIMRRDDQHVVCHLSEAK